MANKDKNKDIDEESSQDIPAEKPADMSGEVPDPIFDDTMPIKPSSDYMPDPIFDDAKGEKSQKRHLSKQELDELSASIPEDLKLNQAEPHEDLNPARHTPTPKEPPKNPFASGDIPQNDAKDDLSDIPLVIKDDPEMKIRQNEKNTAHSPDIFAPDGPDSDKKDAKDKLAAETVSSAASSDYDAPDAFSAEESDIKTDNLAKGGQSFLSDKDPTLQKILVGCGWDMDMYDGEPLDLDLSCFLLNRQDMTREDSDFVFYNNPKGADLAVIHSGDNRTGAGEGDDETIAIDLNALPYEIAKIVLTVTIYDGEEKGYNFGSVKNAFIRIVNADTKVVLARFDLSTDFAEGTALRFGKLERIGNSWTFHADGSIEDGGLSKIAQSYGILIAGT